MKNKTNSNIGSELFTVLKEQVLGWKYGPSHRFTEEALCAEFGVSRSPVREALGMLVENGLVVKEPHKGYRVKQLGLQEIHNLYDVRLALELFVVGQLAEFGMPEELRRKLQDIWQTILENQPEVTAEYHKEDEAFHMALVEANHNQALIDIYRTVVERLYFIRANDITSPERLQRTCEQHLRILDYIQKRDMHQAQEALRINITDGMANIEQALKEALLRAYLGTEVSRDQENP